MGGGGLVDENGEPLTPTSAWRAAKKLAKVAIEPVCLGVLRELNVRLSNRRNQNMFGWAKFVGLRF